MPSVGRREVEEASLADLESVERRRIRDGHPALAVRRVLRPDLVLWAVIVDGISRTLAPTPFGSLEWNGVIAMTFVLARTFIGLFLVQSPLIP